jgi:hypothetical protein
VVHEVDIQTVIVVGRKNRCNKGGGLRDFALAVAVYGFGITDLQCGV